MNYQVVIGIEIHLELKTISKMFSGAPVLTNQPPNSCVSPIDLALPGTMPCVNKQAVVLALMACKVTNCAISDVLKFDRKNYYYSDLPKGYQITQQFHPIGQNGWLKIETGDGYKKIRINRIHLEEDTAKQFHKLDGTYLDFNRAGTPLIEIVSEADIENAQQAVAYIEKIRAIMYYLGVSDCKMEEGSLRCDVNISLRPYGYLGFGNKVEIKNLNSLANVKKAIEVEIIRQNKVLNAGESVVQATYRYDENTRATIMMRKKEGNVDYKYFPEPNIPPIRLSQEFIDKAFKGITELPQERVQRYLALGLNDYDANLLVDNKELGDYFDLVSMETNLYKQVCNWLTGEFTSYLNKTQMTPTTTNILPKNLAALVMMVDKSDISLAQAKVVFKEMASGESPKCIVEKLGFAQVSDMSIISQIVEEVLQNNQQSINDYMQGKDKALGYLVGQVMKQSKGQVNPNMANQLLKQALTDKIKE